MAAGNDSSVLDDSHIMSIYAKKFSNIILVASSSKQRVISHFSNYSSDNVHVFAPGQNIFSTLTFNAYGHKSGTSMAAPIVSGIVALVLSNHGMSAAKNMRDRIIKTSHKFETLSGKVYSNGLVDAYNAITGQLSLNFIWNN